MQTLGMRGDTFCVSERFSGSHRNVGHPIRGSRGRGLRTFSSHQFVINSRGQVRVVTETRSSHRECCGADALLSFGLTHLLCAWQRANRQISPFSPWRVYFAGFGSPWKERDLEPLRLPEDDATAKAHGQRVEDNAQRPKSFLRNFQISGRPCAKPSSSESGNSERSRCW